MINQSLTDKQNLDLIFEHPLQERVRGFLRLESLFIQYNNNCALNNQENHFHALKILFEILEILKRSDTRAELIKELARLSKTFTLLSENPEVDTHKLDIFLKQIKQLHQWVLNYQGKFGDQLYKTPFIVSVKHRTNIPGGSSAFDCPELFLFLNQSKEKRREQLDFWLENIIGVKTSIEVILTIIRQSSGWEDKNAPQGNFVINGTEQPLQLLRIKLPNNSNIFPEFSCGKHRSNIYFMRFDKHYKKQQLKSAISFKLSCCY